MIDLRALSPVLTVPTSQATLTKRNGEGKVLVSVTVNGDLDGPPTAVEMEQVAGYERAAAKARASLVKLSLRPVDGTLFDLVARAMGREIHRAPPGPTIALDRGAPTTWPGGGRRPTPGSSPPCGRRATRS